MVVMAKSKYVRIEIIHSTIEALQDDRICIWIEMGSVNDFMWELEPATVSIAIFMTDRATLMMLKFLSAFLNFCQEFKCLFIKYMIRRIIGHDRRR